MKSIYVYVIILWGDIFLNQQFLLHKDTAVYYTSPLLDTYSVPHAFFTRHGGVSTSPFDTLNFAVGTGENRDDAQSVLLNHRIAASVFGLDETSVCRTYQTHSTTVLLADENDRGRGTVLPPYDCDVDGPVTVCEELILSVRSADCVPILLYDVKNDICGAVHSGWRGTQGNISGVAIEKMCALGSDKKDIIAAIGPCAGVCCYEVGAELYHIFTEINKDYSKYFVPKENGKYFLDLTGLNTAVLINNGIDDNRISACNICTCCNTKDFFSHRVMGKERGTMASFIMNRRKAK